ncbi:MAG: rane protein [Glaciihabitans sp.]|nr:rane protein [Glaciihabitans sp.]
MHVNQAVVADRPEFARRNLIAGMLLGVGCAAFLDETVFHQLLHWHHFYDRSTPDAGLVSDGIFHAFGFFAAIGSMFMLADLSRRHGVWWARWGGGIFLGAGAFQLYDGTIQHKVLGLHQIRYDVDLLPYDTIWNVVAAILLALGVVLVLRTNVHIRSSRSAR